MTKSIVVLGHFLIFFFIGLFIDGPGFDITLPASAKPGESFNVEVVIHKGDYKDFARFMQVLPEGFTASELESDGAKFLFENNAVKFIWYSAPSKKDLKISYKVNVPADASGEKQITGKYSYVENGSSTAVNIDSKTIMIGSGNTASTGTTTNFPPPDTMAKPPVTIAARRVVPAEAQNEFNVEISVSKGDLRSFAKIQDSLPAGFTASELQSDGAQFLVEGNRVKFTWFDLPERSELKVSYKVTVSPDVSGAQQITGFFSYVENEKGKIAPIEASAVNIIGATVAATGGTGSSGAATGATGSTDAGKTPDNTAIASGSTGATGSTGDNGSSTTASGSTGATGNTGDNGSSMASGSTGATGSSGDNGSGITPVKSAQTSVNYRVQIAAMSRFVETSVFSGMFNITEKIDAEMQGGLNKYLVGAFGNYKDARDKRETIRSKGVSDAFVTAYNNGKRITVQEALMLSSQQWVR